MATHQEYKLALQAFQSQRLRRDLADLAAEPQYQKIGHFFFEEMYGPRDFTMRDKQAQQVHKLVHRVPGITHQDVEPVLALLELTNELDEEITTLLMAREAPLDFDEALYERAYRQADNYAERVSQIELVITALGNVHRLSRNKLLGVALHGSQGFAYAAGLGDIHRFLRLGYQAIRPVHDVARLLTTIGVRERERLDRIYARG
jgi:hypothetical protein